MAENGWGDDRRTAVGAALVGVSGLVMVVPMFLPWLSFPYSCIAARGERFIRAGSW